LWVTELRSEERSLEDLSLDLTSDDNTIAEPEGAML
jgi:hypothetical protein